MQVGDLKTGQIAVRNSLRQGKSGPSPAIPDLIRSKTAKNICKTHGGQVYYDAKAEFASFSQTENRIGMPQETSHITIEIEVKD